MPRTYPFSAIIGQHEMKLALLIAAVEPAVGGILVIGDRGTGKSTAVRALAELLPDIETRAGCPCHCAPGRDTSDCLPACQSGDKAETARIPVPVVDLPLGATEDRVVGSLDLEQALVHGKRVYEPGLLAKANRGFLYVDEVNLLDDHLVDLLLDAAASGENVVEREGLSIRHPARFVLVGSGNPEEGELRPQLLDRFGLSVEIATPKDIDTRIEIIRQRDAFERDPDAFCEKWSGKNTELRQSIGKARDVLPDVCMSDDIISASARLCAALGTDGIRGELAMVKAARARAALAGRTTVELADLKEIAPMALCHRMRRDPLDETGSHARIERTIADVLD